MAASVNRWLVQLVVAVPILVSCLNVTILAQEAPPLTDTMGDPLPNGAVARMGNLRWRHRGNITFVALIEDGKKVLTSCGEGVIHVWDSQTGKEVFAFGEPIPAKSNRQPDRWGGLGSNWCDSTGSCWCAVSHDGQTAAILISEPGRVKRLVIWDVATGKEQKSYEPGATYGLSYLTISRDDKEILLGQDEKTQVWNLETDKLNEIEHKSEPDKRSRDLGSISPDGNFLAATTSHGGHALDLWDLQKAKVKLTLSDPTDEKFISMRSAPLFSPDSKQLVWSWADGTIHLCDVQTGKAIREMESKLTGRKKNRMDFAEDTEVAPYNPVGFVFSQDGAKLAALDLDQTIRVFNVSSGKEINHLGTVVPGYSGKQALVWRSRNYEQQKSAFAWSRDEKTFAVGTENILRLWDIKTGKGNDLGVGHQGDVSTILVAADGKTITTLGSDNIVRTWDAATAKELRRSQLPSDTRAAQLLNPIRAVVSTSENTLSLVQLKPGGPDETRFKVDTSEPLRDFDASGRGDMLAIAEWDSLIRVVRLSDGKQAAKISDIQRKCVSSFEEFTSIESMCCSPDGRVLAMHGEHCEPGFAFNSKNLLRVYDITQGRLLWTDRENITGQGDYYDGLQFSPTSRCLAYLERDHDHGAHVVVYEATTGLRRCRFLVSERARMLSFSRDGRYLALGTLDGAVSVLNMNDGKELVSFTGHLGPVRCLAFSLDAGTLYSGGAEGTVLAWKTSQLLRPRENVEVSAEAAGELWQDLASEDGDKVHHAIITLCASPKQAVALFKERIKTASEVRSSVIAQWIDKLDDDSFVTREKASEELAKIGAQIFEPLLERLESKPSPETRSRIEKLLRHPAVTLCAEIRAIEVLETIGTPEAEALLNSLAKGGPSMRLTLEAESALRGLARK